jgi:branched-chain amino acid aminotransferase
MHFNIQKSSETRIHEVDFKNLVFGKIFSDHMLIVDYIGDSWQTPQIMPYGKFLVAPSMSVFHHAQAIFEGMKVYKNADGEPLFFRAIDNFHRMNVSGDRMCMPPIPEDLFINGLKELIKLDQTFIPDEENSSLYIRPVYFATDEAIGVKASQNYRLIIFTTPTGAYYAEPLKVYIETKYSRSAEGGTGFAKAAGNYGGSFHPTRLAMEKGYHQLIWTDASENKYVEESGSMNLMFVFGDTLVTPSLSHSKLAGITRDSVLKLAKHFGIKTEERNITVDEVIAQFENGNLKEAFGCGTAANIAQIQTIGYGDDQQMELPAIQDRKISTMLGKALNDIKMGKAEDVFGWVTKL